MLRYLIWTFIFFYGTALLNGTTAQIRNEISPSDTTPSNTVVDKPYTYVIDTLQNHYLDIGVHKLWIAMDSTDSWTIETASDPKTQHQYMFKLDYHEQYSDLEPYSTYWGKIHIKNTLTDHIKGILEVSPKNSFVDVYIRQPDSSFGHQRTGQYVPVSERAIQADVSTSVWLELPPGKTQEIYIKIKRITGFVPRFGLSLTTPEYWINRKVSFEEMLTGFIMGALAIMAFFFLFYFITTKDKTYLYYALFLFSVALYYLFDYQYYYADALLGRYIHFKLYVWLLTSLYAVFLVLFVRSFLNIPKRFPQLNGIFRLMIITRLILLIAAITALATNYDFDLADRIYSMGYNNIEVPVWLIIIGFLWWKCRSWADRIMLLGVWIFMLCFSFVLLSFQHPNLFDYQRMIPYSYNIGFTMQVICLSVALGIRQRNSQRAESRRLERKVRERTQQINEQTVKLRNLSQFRSRLIANVSHEFRTPLTLIIRPLNRLIEEKGKESAVGSLFAQMKAHAESLLRLVEQLLILSRIESDSFVLERTRADIVEYLHPALSLFCDQARRQQISYEMNLPSKPVMVQADLAKISIVVNNLLSNAFKFTPKGGKVTINMLCKEDLLQISVQDTGIGIAPQEQQVIFDRFYQSEDGKKHDVSGTGIGLSLTQELVQLHGGAIQVESQSGVGTTFTVSLPVVEEERITLTAAPEGSTASEAKPASTNEPHLAPTTAPKVLLVEDNSDMQQDIKLCLQYQFRLTIAPDGLRGQELAEAKMPDLIITDLAMPKRDGLQLTQTLKNNPLTSHIPIIMLTARADLDHQVQGWQHGADAYITKPFDDDLLMAQIHGLLEERNRLRNYYQRKFFQRSEKNNLSPQDSSPQSTDPFLEKLKTVLEARYANSKLDVDQLSDEMALSSSQLNRKLKSLVGKPTNEFIRSYRLQKAAELLIAGGYDIAQVAYETGFTSPSYFTHRFSKQFGCTPSEYQKRGIMPDP